MKAGLKALGGMAVLCLWAGAQAQVMWQTTHTNNEGGGYNSGNCLLKTASLRVRVLPASLDVEEDAEIGTVGAVSVGNDGKSLEIVGTMDLPAGSAITGALLWDGPRVLQGNLLDRHAADSLYEEMVDRNSKPPVRPRDPLIIEKISEGQYRFRIYPVSLGFTRHLRVRYQLPAVTGAEGVNMPFKAGIATLFSGSNLQIPVTFEDGGRNPKAVLTLGTGVRTEMTLPRTRIMSPTELASGGNAWDVWGNLTVVPGAVIQPSLPMRSIALRTRLATGLMAGSYLNLYATVSQDVLKALNIRSATSLSVTVRNSKKAYELPMTCEGGLAAGCGSTIFQGKSDLDWNDTLEWSAFDGAGKLLAHAYLKATVVEQANDTNAAVLWASSPRRFSEKAELPGGPAYGFIDEWASLLSLPKDSIPAELMKVYAENGVPRIVNVSLKDVIPNYVEGQVPNDPNIPPIVPVDPWNQNPTTVIAAQLGSFADAKAWKIERLNKGFIVRIEGMKAGLVANVELYDLAGKRAGAWAARSEEGALNLSDAGVRPGIYFVKIRIAGRFVSKRIVL